MTGDLVAVRRAQLVGPGVDLAIDAGAVLVVELLPADGALRRVVPLVTAVPESVAADAAAFFGADPRLLVDVRALARQVELEGAQARVVLEFDGMRLFVEEADALVEPRPPATPDPLGWELFCCWLEERASPSLVQLPPFDSRRVWRHLLALRSADPADRDSFLALQHESLEAAIEPDEPADPWVEAWREDTAAALEGRLSVSAGFSVVVPVRRFVRALADESWRPLGVVDVVVGFGLPPRPAAFLFAEVARQPARFVRLDLSGDPRHIREDVCPPRLVRDDDLVWCCVDTTRRRRFSAYDEVCRMGSALAGRAGLVAG